MLKMEEIPDSGPSEDEAVFFSRSRSALLHSFFRRCDTRKAERQAKLWER
jgi:hypothetical protein